MFGFNGNGKKHNDKQPDLQSIFDSKSVDEFVERLSKVIEDEIKKQLKKFQIEYGRDEHKAINTAITAKIEERAKAWVCPRLPKWVNSDMLTVLGFLSSFITASGFVFGFFDRNYLVLIIVGFILNWFGDSFDGSLARYRKNTRPNYGYYIDHVIDGISVFILGLGIGLSGFIRIEIALLFVIAYLILIIHVELVNFVQNEFKYTFGLIGPTEYRIIGCILAVVMYFLPVKYYELIGYTFTQYDLFGIFAVVVMFLLIVLSVLSKGVELDKLDRRIRESKK